MKTILEFENHKELFDFFQADVQNGFAGVVNKPISVVVSKRKQTKINSFG